MSHISRCFNDVFSFFSIQELFARQKNSNFIFFLLNISYILVFLHSFIIPFTDDMFFHFSLFNLVFLLFRRRCQSFSRLFMPTITGDCGHL